MKTYIELKREQELDLNAFPMGFDFNDKQLTEGLDKLGVTKSEVIGIPGGGFIRKSDNVRFFELFSRQDLEMREAMKNDAFLTSAIRYELGNHEYCITYDSSDTPAALGLALDDERKKKCFADAKREYLDNCDY